MTADNYKHLAIGALFGIGTDTAIAAADRIAALNLVLFHSPAPIRGDDRFEITTAGEQALAEAEAADAADREAADTALGIEGEQTEAPKRKRRTKAEMEAARAEEAAKAAALEEHRTAIADSTAESAEQIRRAISDTPEDRQEPAGAVEESGDPTDAEPEVDWDAPEEPKADTAPVTKTELIALLNRYAAKHPKKAAGAKEVLSTYAGTESLSAVDPSDYGAIATAMRTYLEAA